ncbi:unnamed protein product [Ambrosiozyma monospora]|uniref:DNA-binding protein RAP1 n=1 Tax=Ambrosiozyma monospora TaxID=43982 RepID=A0A9W7DE46_AMBMO|nr:unnamed protein product [Ambrosiozyma monospora]
MTSQSQNPSSMPENSDLFVDAVTAEPLKFLLSSPLDEDEKLEESITSNGGSVVQQPDGETIILAKPDSIPEEYKKSHKIYNYKLIENSIAKSFQVRFDTHLLSSPSIVLGPPSGGSTSTSESPRRNYFTAAEDAMLIEEVRKRPWFSYKGRPIYEEILKLDCFKGRTVDSLRERMRKLQVDLQYVYVANNSNVLKKGKDGKYLRDYNFDKKKHKAFTALEDFQLARDAYKTSDTFDVDDYYYESVVLPTGFFQKFSSSHGGIRTPESYRQRFKNYLLTFGVTVYLKYYLTVLNNGEEPLPSNTANSNWLKARKAAKGLNKSLKFPGLDMDDDTILEDMNTVELGDEASSNSKAKKGTKRQKTKKTKSPQKRRKLSTDVHSDSDNESPDSPTPKARGKKKVSVLTKSPKKAATRSSNRIREANKSQVVDSESEMENEEMSDSDSVDEPNTNVNCIINGVNFAVPTTEMVDWNLKPIKSIRPPITFDKAPEEKEFLQKAKAITEEMQNAFLKLPATKASSHKQAIFKKARRIGINPYYLSFLVDRSAGSYLIESLKVCYRSQCNSILTIRPGVWSTKAIELLLKNDESIDKVLREYHGENSFKLIQAKLRKGNESYKKSSHK